MNDTEQSHTQHHLDHLLTTVIDWCHHDAPDWFDDAFVHSLYIQHFEGKELSPRQVAALENIALKFDIK